jgi:hypothetical protein
MLFQALEGAAPKPARRRVGALEWEKGRRVSLNLV